MRLVKRGERGSVGVAVGDPRTFGPNQTDGTAGKVKGKGEAAAVPIAREGHAC